MARDIRSWREVADEETKAAIDSTPIRSAAGVRHLLNAMFATCKIDDMRDNVQLAKLAFLTGMACAVLSDYADLLDSCGRMGDK